MSKPRLHPESWRNLRQLVDLHGIDAIEQAVRVLRMDYAPMSPMPWCERCQGYHHATAPHIKRNSDVR